MARVSRKGRGRPLKATDRPATTTFYMEADVRAYLAQLTEETERPMGWLINHIIRMHAREGSPGTEQLRMFPVEPVTPPRR